MKMYQKLFQSKVAPKPQEVQTERRLTPAQNERVSFFQNLMRKSKND